jgi:hypothetical protein
LLINKKGNGYYKKINMIIIILPLMLVFISSAAFAVRVEYGKNLVITKPVFEDVYIAVREVTINN